MEDQDKEHPLNGIINKTKPGCSCCFGYGLIAFGVIVSSIIASLYIKPIWGNDISVVAWLIMLLMFFVLSHYGSKFIFLWGKDYRTRDINNYGRVTVDLRKK